MKKSKVLISLLCLFSVSLSSCNNTPPHEHTFNSSYEYDETYHWHPATCGHDVQSEKEAHIFSSTVTEPTYDREGYTTYRCLVCGYSYTDDETDKLEHNYSSEWSYNSSSHWHACTDEGYEHLKKDEGSHTFTTSVTDPTYESGGYTTYTCSVCGYSYTDDEIGALPITITWENYDGTVLEVDNNVPYGSMPSYNGATPTKESDSNNDYYFAGWTPEVVRATESTTYTATFSSEEITYTIDFDLNGGTSSSYNGPIEVKTFSKDIFFFDCVKEGWSFRGWEYQNEKIFDEKGNQLKNVTLVDDMVFKAIYTQTVKLTIVINIPEAGTITGEGEYPYNTYVDVSATPNQGYRFIGWYYQGTLLSNTEDYKYMMWDQDITLEARFELDYFTMRVYSNSEEHGLVLLRSNSNFDYLPEYEEQRRYTSDVTIAAYSKTDVRFLGWYDENNQLVTPNAVYSFVMPNHDYTLEAKWNYFEITYNLNGGVNNENNPTSYSIDDDNIVLNAPTKEGYEFVGWKYNDEFINEIDTSIADDITLEAVWSSYKYTIKEDSNGNKYASIIDFDDSIAEVYIPSEVVVDSESIPVKEIGSRAFENSTIISITIPDSVTSIGSYAFYGCDSLISITIPDSVTSISNSTFSGCSSLATVTIGENSQLTSIDSYAFYNCSSLTSITVLDSVISIGDYAFSGCSSLTIYCEAASEPDGWSSSWNYSNCPVMWSAIGSGTYNDFEYLIRVDENSELYIEITNYLGTDTSVVIPDTINIDGEDIPVTTIGDNVFNNNDTITSATIGNNLTIIGSRAFYDCDSLTSITIPDSVTSIGYYAFAYCDNLTTVTFGENTQLTTIGEYAFYRCSSLTSIVVPNSVTSIGKWAFDDCDNLIIYCEATSEPSGWASNWNYSDCPVVWGYTGISGEYNGFEYVVSVDSEGNKYITIIVYNGTYTNVVIPNTINLDGEDIPVATIGDYAFSKNYAITSVTIGDNVTSIGEYAFYNCSNITTVTVGENSLLTSIADYAFYGCSSLTSIVIPDSVTTIGSYAFHNCSNLNTVTIGENSQLTSIADYAFYGCSSLTSIVIPDSVTTIGSYALYGCSNLATVTFGENSQLTSIGSYAFRYCPSLTSIIIPGSVTTIGDYAFASCDNLTTVTFGENSQLTSIGSYAFAYCDNFTTVTFGENSQLTSIGSYAFYNCDSLTSIAIPNSVTSISSSAFRDCSNLTTVTFGNNSQLTTIGSYAFYECSSLISIIIPDSVTSIGNYAFYNCYNLTTVTFGENSQLTTIGSYAFYECSSLTSITIPNSVTSIGNNAFYGCDNLTSIIIPDSVTSIGNYAFYNCYNLTTVTFGDNSQLTTIGNYAFYNCDSLTSIAIPNSVTSIGSSAVRDCFNLGTVIFGENSQLTTIGSYAFSDCFSLTSIIIPEGVTTIGDYAFYNCSNLIIYCGASSKPSGWISNWNSSNRPVVWVGGDIIIVGDYTYVVRTDGEEQYVEIVIYLGDETKVVIPDTISVGGVNIPVTSIGEYAFYNCSSLTSITIPNSVTSIGNNAFYGCDNLTSIIIPNSVISIGYSAFYNCNNLTIYCEATSKPSGWSSSWNSSNCPVVWVGGDIIIIGDYAYVVRADGEERYVEIVTYLGDETNVVIPDTISVGDEDIPVTSIGECAFYDNDTITSVMIGNNVTIIGDSAFQYCSNLTTVTFGENSQLTTIGDDAFYNCPNLTTVTFGENSQLTAIGDAAFCGCFSLTSITIPNSVITIGSGAFLLCSSLTIYCEATSTPSGWDSDWNVSNCPVVWGCSGGGVYNGLRYTIYYEEGNLYISITEYVGSNPNIVIPDSINVYGKDIPVTTIGEDAFYDNDTITSVTIGNNVTTIGSWAFFNCNNLITVTFGDNSQLTTIADDVFYRCSNLTTVTFGENSQLTTIGSDAFCDCSSLTSIIIPNSVASIGSNAFAYCSNLTTIIFGDNSQLTTIGDDAFYYCSNLTTVTFGENSQLTTIGNSAFSNCYSLTSIIIPDSVTTIGSSAFDDCDNLIIYCETASKPSGWNYYWNNSHLPVVWGYKR